MALASAPVIARPFDSTNGPPRTQRAFDLVRRQYSGERPRQALGGVAFFAPSRCSFAP
jgi:hypothetical protein